jgi:hypothetical protein
MGFPFKHCHKPRGRATIAAPRKHNMKMMEHYVDTSVVFQTPKQVA